jgi:integrase/recombinase XerD
LAWWLHAPSHHTRRAYAPDAAGVLPFDGKPLRALTLGDLQAFATALADPDRALSPASQARTLAAAKSLPTFGQRSGYLQFNVGAALRLPRLKNTLAERLLPEAPTQRLLALEPDVRNRALLLLCYAAGLRVSELVGLTWRDLQPRANGDGQATIYGEGSKTRHVLLPASIWRELMALREVMSTYYPGSTAPDAPIFRSR